MLFQILGQRYKKPAKRMFHWWEKMFQIWEFYSFPCDSDDSLLPIATRDLPVNINGAEELHDTTALVCNPFGNLTAGYVKT